MCYVYSLQSSSPIIHPHPPQYIHVTMSFTCTHRMFNTQSTICLHGTDSHKKHRTQLQHLYFSGQHMNPRTHTHAEKEYVVHVGYTLPTRQYSHKTQHKYNKCISLYNCTPKHTQTQSARLAHTIHSVYRVHTRRVSHKYTTSTSPCQIRRGQSGLRQINPHSE